MAAVPIVHDLMRAMCGPTGGRLIDRGGATLAWREVAGRACEVSNGLLAAGVGRSDRVGLVAGNGTDRLLVEVGIASIGAAIVSERAIVGGPLAALIAADAEMLARVGAGAGTTRIVIDGPADPAIPTLALLQARGVAWAASNPAAARDTLAAVTGTDALTLDADGPLSQADWAARAAALAFHADDTVLVRVGLDDRTARAAAYRAMVLGASLAPDDRAIALAGALGRIEPTVAVVAPDELAPLARACEGLLAGRSGLRRALARRALDGVPGVTHRAFARHLVRPVLGRALRLIICVGPVRPDDHGLLERLGVAVVTG